MAPFGRLWSIVTNALCSLTIYPSKGNGGTQQPIGSVHHALGPGLVVRPNLPTFPPAGSNINEFECTYPDMPGWQSCQTDVDKSCWLISPDGKSTFDINTDYEAVAPIGIDRYYDIEVEDAKINADGRWFDEAKLFNKTYPGPLIEGDRLHIKVTNKLKHNGTSIHWHGIRQNHTMQMDDLNGVTQCPIAPEDHFWYNFTVTQYGSSWYHSHYSVQYADGAHAPITLHGPTSASFDEAVEPLIMTDCYHNSAFEVEYTFDPFHRSILLNGIGNITRFNGTHHHDHIRPAYNVTFNETGPNPASGNRRYLMRLVNTAFDSGFVFSIDNHYLTVVEVDFVPIKPYTTTSVVVAIGQRYHVIVEAKPATEGANNPIQADGNYWIRTWIAQDCSNGNQGIPGYERIGIVRYNRDSEKNPESGSWSGISLLFVDERHHDIHPVVSWQIGPAAHGKHGEEFKVTRIQTEYHKLVEVVMYKKKWW